MRVYIIQKAITKINPLERNLYETNAITLKDFIKEMIEKNYNKLIKNNKIDGEELLGYIDKLIEIKNNKIRVENKVEIKIKKLEEYLEFAYQAFEDSIYFVVNKSKDIKYLSLNENMNLSEGDEIVLIKLKYVRGMVY